MSPTGANGKRIRSRLDSSGVLRQPSAMSAVSVSPALDALARTGEYSIFGLKRAEEPTLARDRRMSFAVVSFGIATIVAVLYSVERYFQQRLLGQPVSLAQIVPAELVFSYIWALLAPLVMWSGRRFPVWGAHHARDARTALINWAAQVVAA